MTIESFLIFSSTDPFGICTEVRQVPAKRISKGGFPEPACPMRLVQDADRIIGVDPSGRMSYVYKDRAGGKVAKQTLRRINAHNRKKQTLREKQAMTLLEHLEAWGIVIAIRERSGNVNILASGNFRMNNLPDGKHEFIGVATNDATERDKTIEVKL
jgi:hypothetical protein